MDRPDEQLIALCQQGDEEAFAELVERYQRKVYTMAVRMLQDREESRDAAQEVFIRVYRALPGWFWAGGFDRHRRRIRAGL